LGPPASWHGCICVVADRKQCISRLGRRPLAPQVVHCPTPQAGMEHLQCQHQWCGNCHCHQAEQPGVTMVVVEELRVQLITPGLIGKMKEFLTKRGHGVTMVFVEELSRRSFIHHHQMFTSVAIRRANEMSNGHPTNEHGAILPQRPATGLKE